MESVTRPVGTLPPTLKNKEPRPFAICVATHIITLSTMAGLQCAKGRRLIELNRDHLCRVNVTPCFHLLKELSEAAGVLFNRAFFFQKRHDVSCGEVPAVEHVANKDGVA